MTLRGGLLLVLAGLSGLALGHWGWSEPPVPPRLACRPSDPVAAVAGREEPVILYLGNSIVFDHPWDIPGTQPVNCARQGLRADAMPLDQLPAVTPALIVVGFGTVELVQATRAGAPADGPAFAAALSRLFDHLAARYPGAPVLVLEPPEGDFAAADRSALIRAARPLAPAWAEAGPTRTYDGIHLTPGSYAAWRTEIAQTLR